MCLDCAAVQQLSAGILWAAFGVAAVLGGWSLEAGRVCTVRTLLLLLSRVFCALGDTTARAVYVAAFEFRGGAGGYETWYLSGHVEGRATREVPHSDI